MITANSAMRTMAVAFEQRLKSSGGEDKFSSRHIGGCQLLVGVYDGHRGPGAAEFCAHAIPDLVATELAHGLPTSNALAAAFLRAHKQLESRSDDDKSGTTATVALVSYPRVVLAHVGDSKAILVQSNGEVVILTRDHRCNDPQEHHRLCQAGCRVLGGRVGGLQLSRSLGEKEPAIVPLAVTTEFQLRLTDVAVVVASDGLWEVVTPEEVGKIVALGGTTNPGEAAGALADLAIGRDISRGRRPDDITIAILTPPLIPSATPAAEWSFERIMALDRDTEECRTAIQLQ